MSMAVALLLVLTDIFVRFTQLQGPVRVELRFWPNKLGDRNEPKKADVLNGLVPPTSIGS